MHSDILIIGGGVAGLTAALYARRAGKTVRVLERETPGGQITAATRVDNYPGLPAVSGLQLADALLAQAMNAGAEIEMENAVGMEITADGFAVHCEGRAYRAKSVIIASGARHKPLGLDNESALVGRGVSYCAVCDGAFHKGEDVAVAGGGNSAAQAALFLADLCHSVTVVQEFAHFTCDAADYDAMRHKPNIHFLTNTRVAALLGKDALEGLRVCGAGDMSNNGSSAGGSLLPVTGLFVCIGRVADNAPFAHMLALDAQGFIRADESCRTAVPGLFCAGDCRAKSVRQLTTAAADGATAALAACRFII